MSLIARLAAFIGLTIWLLPLSSPLARAAGGTLKHGSLLELGAGEFPDLTRAERALLVYADVRSRAPGDFAIAGTSAVSTDPSNDPMHADRWDHQRDVRAELIRWLAVDPDASHMVDPRGIRLLGARITGKLDLSHVNMPFGLALIRCVIPEQIDLDSIVIPKLNLAASAAGEIYAPSISVHGDADIGWDGHDYGNQFSASGEVYAPAATVDGDFSFRGGRFHSSKIELGIGGEPFGPGAAIDLSGARIKGNVTMCCDLRAKGRVTLDGSDIDKDLLLFAGHFTNPGNVALDALGAKIGESVVMSEFPPYGEFEANGLVSFVTAHVGNLFYVHRAHFSGKANDTFGLDASGLRAETLFWQNVDLADGGMLKLTGASVYGFNDDIQSWPKRGRLFIDDLEYHGIGPPNDARTRLRWIALQPPPYRPQPYRELAKFLADSGDANGAAAVMIALGDARYSQYGVGGRALGWLLKVTIGYGHRPLLALVWSLAVVMVGWLAVEVGKRAGLMRETWPENNPSDSKSPYEELSPLLYSLDVFLPFVNLHQEHYWWPDARSTRRAKILGVSFACSGRALRIYLWLQIIAGWLLSAIFVAGVTGLIRND